MRIIITGGSGFIGTTISRLLKTNHELAVFDHQKPRLDGVKFEEGNILDSKRVLDAMKNYDVVIHLAAALGVVNTEQNPIATIDTNTIGTRNVLEACRINGIKKIIFSSSSEVYGEPLKIPIEESDRPIPMTPYGVSKLVAEEYIKSYAKVHGIRYTIFRLFNVYGEEQHDQWVLPEFVNKAIKNEDIKIHGDGSQIRAFCHVSDAANAFASVLKNESNEIFNIGNDGEPISIKELAKKVISIARSKSTISFIPFEKSNRNRTEILTRVPSIKKAGEKLGYKPQISLDEGITRMVNKRI